MSAVNVLDLGLRDYRQIWELQKQLVVQRATQQISDQLILVEHSPVYTIGRGFSVGAYGRTPLRSYAINGVPCVAVERGGAVTFHGPGQLVGYPILDLRPRGCDVRRYLRELEEALILALADFGITATRRDGLTGVWTDKKKIASIGIAVKHWVSYHGFALNVSTDLSYFRAIQPCGLDGAVLTSMSEQLARAISLNDVKSRLLQRFQQMFAPPLRSL